MIVSLLRYFYFLVGFISQGHHLRKGPNQSGCCFRPAKSGCTRLQIVVLYIAVDDISIALLFYRGGNIVSFRPQIGIIIELYCQRWVSFPDPFWLNVPLIFIFRS